ncbi:unnamed protein product [Heterobilharzia americana]|nr:unnamed protein product [Heterobilharzia americana]
MQSSSKTLTSYMNLQSRWDEVTKLNWNKVDIPPSKRLSGASQRSKRSSSITPSSKRFLDIDLSSTAARNTPVCHDRTRASPVRNLSSSTINSSVLDSTTSTVTLGRISPDCSVRKSLPCSPVYYNTTKTLDFISDSRNINGRNSNDFETRRKPEVKRKVTLFRKTMPPALPIQILELNISENIPSTSVQSTNLPIENYSLQKTRKLRSLSSDGVRLISLQTKNTHSRNASMSQNSSNRSVKLFNSPVYNNVSLISHTHQDYSPTTLNDTVYSDPVFSTTVQVVKTVSLVSQQIATSQTEKYGALIKNIGATIKELFSAIQTEFGDNVDDSCSALIRNNTPRILKNSIKILILLAERQLNSSMYSLISTTKDAKQQNNRGPLLEEYRRHLMSLAYAIAADAHALYTTVYENRVKHNRN